MKENLRVVLTNTKMGDRICPPFNLCSLAGVTKDKTIETKVIDSQWIGDNKAAEMIFSLDPDVVGITDTTPTHPSVVNLAEKVKVHNRHTIVVLGGKHPTLFPESFVNDDYVDFIVCGEGEVAWKQLLEAAQRNAKDKDKMRVDLSEENGIWFKGQNQFSLTPKVDLSAIESPDYSNLYPSLTQYRQNHPNIEVDVERARGCVGRCPFCVQGNSPQRGIRVKDTSRVVDEINFFLKSGFKRIFLTDDDFAAHPRSSLEICELLSNYSGKVQISANVRTDTFLRAEEKFGFADKLRKAGFMMLYVGLESGSKAIQRYNHKVIDIQESAQMIQVANEQEIGVKLNLIIGSPYETPQTLAETADYLFTLRDMGLAFIPNLKYFLPYPGTQSYSDALNLGLVSPQDLNLAALESHSKAVIPTIGLSAEDVNGFYQKFLSLFYTSEYLRYLRLRHPYLIKETRLSDHSKGE